MTRPIRFPEELPISACVQEIAAPVDAHPVVIVAGETGSGRTIGELPRVGAVVLGLDAEATSAWLANPDAR